MSNRIELWVCQDCMVLEETGDATGFDYHYQEPEASQRLKEVEDGWAALRKQGKVFNDVDGDRTTYECLNCGHVDERDEFQPVWEVDDEDHATIVDRLCTECGSDETRQRDDGELEFSGRTCDCCGIELFGSRHRYALFPNEEII
jgi:hypothetical protein